MRPTRQLMHHRTYGPGRSTPGSFPSQKKIENTYCYMIQLEQAVATQIDPCVAELASSRQATTVAAQVQPQRLRANLSLISRSGTSFSPPLC
jgi:hypothetical protein